MTSGEAETVELTEIERMPEYLELVARQMRDLGEIFARQATERIRLAIALRRSL